ncbi:hypothetical protein ACFFKC_10245 [Pseudoduganella danionis]|uniref:hypothetical protein n=1 Tax=Pseudoduganella danionis TaxID=1890295 RepID=UPI001E4B3583|nr:hypothetical protein [Pseudoduganella danionis]
MQTYLGVHAGLLWLVLSGAAAAQQQEVAVKAQARSVADAAQEGVVAVPGLPMAQGSGTSTLSGWRPLAQAALADKRAGSDTVSNNMDVAGSVSGNAAINVVTGANAISAASFANAAGLPVAIQNSGANVLIQNATIINVQMR